MRAPPVERLLSMHSSVQLVQLPSDHVMVEPEHRPTRAGRLMEHQRPDRLQHQRAEVVRDQRLAVLVHLRDGVRGADHDVGQLGRVRHRPGLEIAEAFRHVAGVEIGDLLQHAFERVLFLEQVAAGLPLRLGPGAAVLLLQRQQQRKQRQLDADKDVR